MVPELDARSRRGTQLALTILAVVLSVGGYVLVTLGLTGRKPPRVAGFVAVIALSYLVAHFVTTRLAPRAEPILPPAAAGLAGAWLPPHLPPWTAPAWGAPV